MQVEGDAVALQALDGAADVVRGGGGAVRVDVSDGEGVGEGGGQLLAAGDADEADDGIAQCFGPDVGEGGDFMFELGSLELRHFAGNGAHQDGDAGQRRLGDLGVEGGELAIIGALKHAHHFLAQGGGETLARDVDHGGDETVERVAAGEEAHLRARFERDDAHGHLEERFVVHLEQLVAREEFEGGLDTLARVRGFVEAGAFHQARGLAAQERNLVGFAVVDGAGEQAENARFAGGVALGIAAADGDIIHIAAAVDFGNVGGGENGDAAIGHGGEGGALDGIPAAIELIDAEGGFGVALQLVGFAVALVIGVAEEHEVVVGEPEQEVVDFLGIVLLRAGGFGEVLHGGQHGAVVGHGLGDMFQRVQHLFFQQRRGELHGQRRQLDIDERFATAGRGGLVAALHGAQGAVGGAGGGENGVLNAIDGEAQRSAEAAQRIDQEGHVVVDGDDFGARQRLAFFGDLLLVNLDEGGVAFAFGEGGVRREGDFGGAFGRHFLQVVQRCEGIEASDKLRQFLAGLLTAGGKNFFDQLLVERGIVGGHKRVTFSVAGKGRLPIGKFGLKGKRKACCSATYVAYYLYGGWRRAGGEPPSVTA